MSCFSAARRWRAPIVVETDLDAGQNQDDKRRDGALLHAIPELSIAGPRLGGPLAEVESAPLGHGPGRQGEGLIHERRVPGRPEGLFDLNTLPCGKVRPLDRRRQNISDKPLASPGVCEPPPVRMIRRGRLGETALPEERLLGVFEFGHCKRPQYSRMAADASGVISPLRFIASISDGSLHRAFAMAAVTPSPPKGKLRIWMICPPLANTATVSRAPTSTRRAISGKPGFSMRRVASGTASMSITAVSRTYSAQECRPIADKRPGGQRGEDLRLIRPAGQRVIDEDVIEGRLDQRFDGKGKGLPDLPVDREKEA